MVGTWRHMTSPGYNLLDGIQYIYKLFWTVSFPDSKDHGANMGPIWGRQGPGGPHVSPMNFAIWATKWCVGHVLQYRPICLKNSWVISNVFIWPFLFGALLKQKVSGESNTDRTSRCGYSEFITPAASKKSQCVDQAPWGPRQYAGYIQTLKTTLIWKVLAWKWAWLNCDFMCPGLLKPEHRRQCLYQNEW